MTCVEGHNKCDFVVPGLAVTGKGEQKETLCLSYSKTGFSNDLTDSNVQDSANFLLTTGTKARGNVSINFHHAENTMRMADSWKHSARDIAK
jgi:hypothetical protein